MRFFSSPLRRACALAGALFAAACATDSGWIALDAPTEQAVEAAVAAPDAAGRIERDVAWLADDGRQGREAGTEGYDEAARYVAGRFAAMGLAPAGERGWFQPVTLRTTRADIDKAALAVSTGEGAPEPLVHLEDYIIARANGAFDVSAPVVFVGHGVVDETTGHDDYEGVDVEGKIVAFFSGAPASFDSETRAHFSSTALKLETAAARGAAGYLSLVSESGEARTSWERMAGYARGASMSWTHPDGRVENETLAAMPGATLSPAGADKVFDGAPVSYRDLRAQEDEDAPLGAFDLPARVSVAGESISESVKSANVAGLIEGADPALKDEVVVLTAHLDHVGVRASKEAGADTIYNGAMDNAMGVATMIEASHAFAQGEPPARTVVFLALTAEEKGLLGADYFAHYPTLAGREIVANVNLDMPLTLYEFTDVVAFGAERSSLGPAVEKAAGDMGVKLSPDPFPEQGLFTRSDHYRFVERGVPSVFLFLGMENGGGEVFADFMANHYHKPSDDLSLPIDYAQAARFAELNYRIAREVADAAQAPRWNAGDFFGDMFGN